MKLAILLIALSTLAPAQSSCPGTPPAPHCVTISWDASTLAGTTYRLFKRAGICPAATISPTVVVPPFVAYAGGFAANSWIDAAPDIVIGASFCYYVTAVVGSTESDPSNYAGADLKPGAPTNVKAVPQ